MNGPDASELIRLLEENGIEVYVDGGWAVDALLGEQTREHADLDIALPHRYVPQLRTLFGAHGFSERLRDDTWECNFVLADERDRQVDVHSYTFDREGCNIYGVAYLPEHLKGTGVIQGYPVKCITPEWLVKFHTGYELDENDYRDTLALCRRFDIPLPAEYERFAAK